MSFENELVPKKGNKPDAKSVAGAYKPRKPNSATPEDEEGAQLRLDALRAKMNTTAALANAGNANAIVQLNQMKQMEVQYVDDLGVAHSVANKLYGRPDAELRQWMLLAETDEKKYFAARNAICVDILRTYPMSAFKPKDVALVFDQFFISSDADKPFGPVPAAVG